MRKESLEGVEVGDEVTYNEYQVELDPDKSLKKGTKVVVLKYEKKLQCFVVYKKDEDIIILAKPEDLTPLTFESFRKTLIDDKTDWMAKGYKSALEEKEVQTPK